MGVACCLGLKSGATVRGFGLIGGATVRGLGLMCRLTVKPRRGITSALLVKSAGAVHNRRTVNCDVRN